MIFTIYGDYIHHYGGKVWVGTLIRLLEAFGHNAQAVRAAISRMQKQGWVQAEKRGNRSFYSLTTQGQKRMREAGKRIFNDVEKEWDGRWRMLIYSIPEDQRKLRDELRKELGWSGFGSLTHSCWLTPHRLEDQVQQLSKRYGIAEYIHFFTGDHQTPERNDELVEKCWDLAAVNERYRQFIDEYSKRFIITRNEIKNQKMNREQCFVERTKLVHEYRKFLFIDPELPEPLLPDYWVGDHASSLFHEYYEVLAEPANEFFESVYKEDNDAKDSVKRGKGYREPLSIKE
ncbi:phenylacetic acid degradation operon negative regulatory protein PaaX [Geomicrobium sp. JSM 1781026]|uniref:phenylacetic acid degradation operon negative regulatory protein PaaX n=1 Tax=Geomicrobium sp. JSM 1781026 TaxID=3344580 RepID=UPI0035C185DB